MAKIIAFTVPSLEDGDGAIAELAAVDEVEDAALVYKNDNGRVKIRQTTDVTAGKGAERGALLATAVGIFVGRRDRSENPAAVEPQAVRRTDPRRRVPGRRSAADQGPHQGATRA